MSNFCKNTEGSYFLKTNIKFCLKFYFPEFYIVLSVLPTWQINKILFQFYKKILKK